MKMNKLQLEQVKNLCIKHSANNKPIPNFKYTVKSDRSFCEKIWWVILLFSSILGCCLLIWDLRMISDDTPVIISTSETATPIWQIPFPAITICPEDKTDINVFNISQRGSKYFQKLSDLDAFGKLEDGKLRSQLMALAQVCSPDGSFAALQDTKFSNCSDCLMAIKEISLQKKHIFANCYCQQFQDDDCDNVFDDTITDEGVCFTFNSLTMAEIFRDETITDDFSFLNHSRPTDQWSLDGGYGSEAALIAYPYRALGVGLKMGFSFKLISDIRNFSPDCSNVSRGFKFMLHLPSEVPQMSKHGKTLSINQEISVIIRPKMMVTDESLRNYHPTERQCYFNDERHLRYFKLYTEQNCLTECLTNFTINQCGCIRLNMPRHSGVKICSSFELACVFESDSRFHELIAEQEPTNMQHPLNCDCRPTCTSITYESEIKHVKLGDNDDNPIKLTNLTFLFEEEQFNAEKRTKMLGQTSFIANKGGLLGFFMGVSLLSVAEIVYFFTIRLICTWRRGKKQAMHAK